METEKRIVITDPNDVTKSMIENLNDKIDLLLERMDNFQRSRKSSLGTPSPQPPAEPNVGKFFSKWRKRSLSVEMSARENAPNWFLSAPSSGDLVYCPLPSSNIRPVSPGADICDRLYCAIERNNMEVALDCFKEGINLNDKVECAKSVGYDKTWIQQIIGRQEDILNFLLRKIIDFIFSNCRGLG